MATNWKGPASPPTVGAYVTAPPIDRLAGRIESTTARRGAVGLTAILWGVVVAALRDSPDTFYDPKHGVAGHLLAIGLFVAVASLGPWIWYHYATVIEVAGRTLRVRSTPRSTPRTYRRSDVAAVREWYDRRSSPVFRIEFRDGRAIEVDANFKDTVLLRIWLDHADDRPR